MMQRRPLLTGLLGLSALPSTIPPAWALPAATLRFPRDHGAHLDARTEWWYITGFAITAQREAAFGFQVTFFRSRVNSTQAMRSQLAARHLLFAHAAITDVAGKKLWHDQRIARWSGDAAGSNGADMASASTLGMEIRLRDWSLLETNSTVGGKPANMAARVQSDGFALNLRFAESQPLLLQGDQGLSRKGPEARQASYYYSRPQLATTGSLSLQGRSFELAAGSTAWLDHEWSQELLHPAAVGWDWIGINMQDGGALTAFRLRDRDGQALWAGGSFRARGSKTSAFRPSEVVFEPVRNWHSALSGASYPVEWQVQTPAGRFTVKAVLDDQELDSRASTGAIYWEGLCEVSDATGRLAGRGYLEMTGYASALRLG